MSGLEPGDTVRLAAMDSYTGRLWNVAGPEDRAADGGYAIVGETLPEPDLATPRQRARARVSVEGYDDVWLPTVGYGVDLRLLDAAQRRACGRPALQRRRRHRGAHERRRGRHRVSRSRPACSASPTPSSSSTRPVASLDLPAVENLPDVVAAKAEEYAGEATSPIEQLRNIERALKTNGFLSHGLASDSVASRAGHGADRLIELFTRTQMVGDEEQYAAAMALMARHLGYPSRVVMGFAPEIAEGDDEVEVVGADVDRVGRGAVRRRGLDLVPTRRPTRSTCRRSRRRSRSRSRSRRCASRPRSEHVEDELLTTVEIDDTDDEDRDRPFQVPAWVWVTAAAVGIPAAIVLPADARRGDGQAASPREAPPGPERPRRRRRVGRARRPVRRARVRAAGEGDAPADRARALEQPDRRAGRRCHDR